MVSKVAALESRAPENRAVCIGPASRMANHLSLSAGVLLIKTRWDNSGWPKGADRLVTDPVEPMAGSGVIRLKSLVPIWSKERGEMRHRMGRSRPIQSTESTSAVRSRMRVVPQMATVRTGGPATRLRRVPRGAGTESLIIFR